MKQHLIKKTQMLLWLALLAFVSTSCCALCPECCPAGLTSQPKSRMQQSQEVASPANSLYAEAENGSENCEENGQNLPE